MKFNAAIIFCLVFLGIAFPQDSSSVYFELPLDSVVVDSTVILVDSTVIAIDTTEIFIDAEHVAVDTTLIPVEDTLDSDFAKIKPGLHYFISVGAQFINFKDRAKFQTLLDNQYEELLYDYTYSLDSTKQIPLKQDFQNVNLAFPITIGIMWHFNDWHSLGIGTGFLYNNESVILTDMDEQIYNFRYALRAFPLFTEYRLLISSDLISLRNGDYFSLLFRYYWMLPGTEIYSSWETVKADLDILGNGFGIFLGYRFWEWEGFSIWGELGYLSLEVKSGNKDFIPNSWNLGGISILLRAMF